MIELHWATLFFIVFLSSGIATIISLLFLSPPSIIITDVKIKEELSDD